MTESDLFVELLDEKELSSMINHYKIVIEGFRTNTAPITRKRQSMKQALKAPPRRKKTGTTLFLQVINGWNIDGLDVVDDDTYLIVLSEMKSIPDYVKFAYTWAKRKHIGVEILPNLIEKHKKGASLFDYSISMESEVEAIRHIRAFYKIDTPHCVEDMIENVESRMLDPQKKQLSEIESKIKGLALHEIFREKGNLVDEVDNMMVYFAFVKTRPDIDPEIRKIYAFYTAIYLIRKIGNESIDKTIESLDDHRVTLKELENSLKKNEKLVKELEKAKALYEKEQVQHQKHQEQSKQQFEDLNTKHQKVLDGLRIKHEKELDKERAQLEVAKRGVARSLERISSWAGEKEPITQFAVIYSHPTDLLIELYPELTSYYIDKWQDHVEEIKCFPVVYVQRDGCSTKQLAEIEKVIIKIRVFNAPGDKEIVEHIEEIKKKEGVLFVSV